MPRTAPAAALLLCFGAMCCADAPASAVIIIDDFADSSAAWPFSENTPGDTTNTTEVGLTGVLGGVRRSALTLASANVPGLDMVSLEIDGGVLNYAASVGANGSLGLTYSNGGSLAANLSAEQFIAIDLADYDAANSLAMPVTVTIEDGGGDIASLTLPAMGGAQSMAFAFANFIGIGSIDLANIAEISVLFDPSFAADFRLNGITADVPAPGALALLATAGLLPRRRRRLG